MRRHERELTSINEILEILNRCDVCRLAMLDEFGRPYIVPLNYGCTYQADQLRLYFHSASEGRKIDLLRRNPQVCFEVDCDHEFIPARSSCQSAFRYQSVIGFGRVYFLETEQEKIHGLDMLMEKQDGQKTHTFDPIQVKRTIVLCLVVDRVTGKANLGGI